MKPSSPPPPGDVIKVFFYRIRFYIIIKLVYWKIAWHPNCGWTISNPSTGGCFVAKRPPSIWPKSNINIVLIYCTFVNCRFFHILSFSPINNVRPSLLIQYKILKRQIGKHFFKNITFLSSRNMEDFVKSRKIFSHYTMPKK